MSDEDIKTSNEQGEEINTQDESSTSEEQDLGEATEAPEEAESTEEAETEEQEAETSGEPKKGYNQRVRELNARTKQAEAKAQSLADRIAELTGSVEPTQYEPQITPGAEVSEDQYRQDLMRTANSIVEIKIKQSEAAARHTNEANDSLRRYPQLDPQSNDFDQELSDTVTEATEAYVSKSPYTASISKFVDRLMKPYQKAITKEVGKEKETLAKQVSQTALRPTSIRSEDKKIEDKSIAELEEELGIIQS